MSPSADPAPLRVHFTAHHHLHHDAGVSGATLALGAALERQGCEVSYYSFDDAYGDGSGREIPRMMLFPWHVAAHLARCASHVDVIDGTTGDAWLWSALGRPGGARTALVTRAHGLEHVSSDDLRGRALTGEVSLSRKYGIYHGGYRLWEVARSLTGADAQIFLNDIDRDYALARLDVPADRASVLPNGVSPALLRLTRISPAIVHGPIRLAFVGSWIDRKGIRAIADACAALHDRGVGFTLHCLGTGAGVAEVRAAFEARVREHVTVTQRYAPEHLAGLLEQAHVLVHPSWTEGFSLALVEGMACGLAPVATSSGGAASVVRNGETGVLLADDRSETLANAIAALAADRALLARLRVAAQSEARALDWDSIAERTIEVYRTVITRRRLPS